MILKVEILDPLKMQLETSDSGIRGTLLAPLRFDVFKGPNASLGTWDVVTVPAGFRTDLASIPRPLWAFPGLAPTDKVARPSILHDWLYGKDCPFACTRLEADQALRAALVFEGEGLRVRTAVFVGVRVGGSSHWKKSS